MAATTASPKKKMNGSSRRPRVREGEREREKGRINVDLSNDRDGGGDRRWIAVGEGKSRRWSHSRESERNGCVSGLFMFNCSFRFHNLKP